MTGSIDFNFVVGGEWVCRKCEASNAGGLMKCRKCGHDRRSKGGLNMEREAKIRAEVAKEIFDRLEDNLFYENDGKDIEISFTLVGWQELKAQHVTGLERGEKIGE